MNEINTSNLAKMGTKPIGGATVTFYTNEAKDTLYLEGNLVDANQAPNMAVLKKVTQSLKGTLIEENAQIFLKDLVQKKKSPCVKIMTSQLPVNGIGRIFVKTLESDFVKAGDVIGRLSEPQAGINGSNLFGQELLATISNEINFTFDETIFIKDDNIVSYRDGKIIYDEINRTLTVNAPYTFEISEDKIEGYLTYIDRVPLTKEIIHKILAENNVEYGVQENQIQEAIKLHQETKKPIRKHLIAKGVPLIETKQGRIIFSFEQNIKRNFDENQSGKVDHKSNNTIQNVKKDERIAIIKKPIPGKPGRNIQGIIINPAEPREATLRCVKNVRVSENQLEFFAEKEGSPVYKHGTISVVDLMVIKGNLSLATGNIAFEGSVFIEGDVGSDYIVKAEGDITIGGSVGSSTLIAGGKIQIGQGFNGRGIGKAECIGDLSVKFMKEVNVNCESNVIVETEALNCNLNILGQLLMEKSNLMGGEINVLSGIFVNEIGSSLGIKTRVNPGVNYLFGSRKSSLEARLEEIKTKTLEINTIIGPILKDKTKLAALAPEKRQRVIDLVNELKNLKVESDIAQQDLTRLFEENKSNKVNEVVVYGKVYPGSTFKIGYSSKEFKTELTGPVLITEDIENRSVRMGPIKMRNRQTTTAIRTIDED
jgi:uncharacterized protein (DUF342 family)